MKFLIANAHNENRGDEAANHALIDELNLIYPGCNITLALRWGSPYPNLPANVTVIQQYSPRSIKRVIEFFLMRITNYSFILTKRARTYVNAVKNADLILHSPGGPSIGDIYYDDEIGYLRSYVIANDFNKPYIFFAPSMGPFHNKHRKNIREQILRKAKAVIVRDPISKKYINEFLPDLHVYQTLDSALQFDLNVEDNQTKLKNYTELNEFLKKHKKNIGITITELDWHPTHSLNEEIRKNIQSTMQEFAMYLNDNGYGIVFIPQLYGTQNDYLLMKKYMVNNDNFFIVPDDNDEYDAYFQQYLISRLYAVVGMRYHSNIFAAKVGTPYISISYEQKMTGFMEKMKLSTYCIDVKQLSFDLLRKKFDMLMTNHDDYKKYLDSKHSEMKEESLRTMRIIADYISSKEKV